MSHIGEVTAAIIGQSALNTNIIALKLAVTAGAIASAVVVHATNAVIAPAVMRMFFASIGLFSAHFRTHSSEETNDLT